VQTVRLAAVDPPTAVGRTTLDLTRFGGDLTQAIWVRAAPAARVESEAHGKALPRQIREATLIPAMDLAGQLATVRTGHTRAACPEVDRDRISLGVDGAEFQAGWVRIDGSGCHGHDLGAD